MTKKRTTSCFIDTLHFRILPAHLWMTAFANSHRPVLRQCNAVIISAVRIYGNLLSQNVRRLFLFLCIGIFNNFKQISFSPIDYYNFIPFIPLLLFSVSSLWRHHTPAEVHGLRPLPREAFPVVGKRNCRKKMVL